MLALCLELETGRIIIVTCFRKTTEGSKLNILKFNACASCRWSLELEKSFNAGPLPSFPHSPMPFPAPSARLLSILRAQINARQFVCSSCLARNSNRPVSQLLRKRLSTRTRITPVTAVNAQKTIPSEYRELYDALSALGDSASIYTNASQLQLALRGLESRDSVTRIAGKTSYELIYD